MDKANVPLNQAYRLLNPGVVVLVSVGDSAKDNLFPVTWNMPVRKSPPMVAILVGKGHYSTPIIAATGEFGLNVPHADLLEATMGCGLTTGETLPNKFDHFGLDRQATQKIRAPLVVQAIANLECRVCQVVDLGAASLFIAQVLEAVAATRYFAEGQWRFDTGLKLPHHLSGERFCISESAVAVRRNGL